MALSAALSNYPHTAALLNHTVEPHGFEVDYVPVEPSIVAAFRRMMRGLEFDFCELGVTSYLAGWDYQNDLTSVPIFPACGFPFRAMHVNSSAGIESPKDLNGKRIACRTYTVTAVVWARGILADAYGVDLDSITWVINDEEHSDGFVWPANVDYQKGADLVGMVSSGEVAAGFGLVRGEVENVRPLFEDPAAEEREWYASTKIFPINHSIALKAALVEADPELPTNLVDYFEAGKSVFMERLGSGVELSPAEKALADLRSVVGPDPVPYGIEATRPSLDALLRYSHEQHITNDLLTTDDIFA
jgi:4,5-dihydroxyphthalate decarboxylase